MRVLSALHHLLSVLNPLRWAAKILRQEGQAHRMSRPVFKRIAAVAMLLAVWALLIDISPNELSAQAGRSLDTEPIVGTPTPNMPSAENISVLGISSPDIIGGGEVDIKNYPWMVALLRWAKGDNFEGYVQYCGGTLIRPDIVLTAAHCLFEPDTNTRFETKDIKALLGRTTLSQDHVGEGRQVIDVEYPSTYDNTVGGDDIALLLLESTSSQSTVRLATDAERSLFSPGTIGEVTGWGRISAFADTTSDVLKSISVTLANSGSCQPLRPDKTLCSLSPELTWDGPFSGDSGGPLFVANDQHVFVQGGIMSKTSKPPWDIAFGRWATYTNIADYQSWIAWSWQILYQRNPTPTPIFPPTYTPTNGPTPSHTPTPRPTTPVAPSNCPNDGRSGVYFYAEKDYQGIKCHYAQHDVGDFAQTQVGDNEVSSVKIIGSYYVEIFEHTYRSGRSVERGVSDPNLDSTSLGGQFSSAIVSENAPSNLISELKTSSGRTYQVTNCYQGGTYYSDRSDYTIKEWDSKFQGRTCIKTHSQDNGRTELNTLSFRLNKAARIYVFYDRRKMSLPNWLDGSFDFRPEYEVYTTNSAMDFFRTL